MSRSVMVAVALTCGMCSLAGLAEQLPTPQFAFYRDEDRGGGISGSYKKDTPVVLLCESTPYTCRAKANQAKTLSNQGGGNDADTTTLYAIESRCGERPVYFLAIVGATEVRYEFLPLKKVADADKLAGLDKILRERSDVGKLRDESRLYHKPKNPEEWGRDPKLMRVYELSLSGVVGHLAQYSAVSGIDTDTYYVVIGNRIYRVGSYWVKDGDGLRNFKVNDVHYLYFHGSGNTTGHNLDVIYRVTPSGFDQILFNDDWAT